MHMLEKVETFIREAREGRPPGEQGSNKAGDAGAEQAPLELEVQSGRLSSPKQSGPVRSITWGFELVRPFDDGLARPKIIGRRIYFFGFCCGAVPQ